MNVYKLDQSRSEKLILDCLKNAGWTQDQIDNITEEQSELVVKAINGYFMRKAKEHEIELKKMMKENQKKFKRALKVLSISDQLFQKILDGSANFQELFTNTAMLEVTKWKQLKEVVGEDAFCFTFDGMLEDGQITEEQHELIMNIAFG